MSRILCIETGTDICSVALAENGKLLSLIESGQGEGRGHAQHLALYVEELLRENRLKAEELDAVAVGKGPGSYTGLRIGVSLAKGLCYAAGVPLIAVNSLEALTHVALEEHEAGILEFDLDQKVTSDATTDTTKEVTQEVTLCPMIDARRMEVYCQLFDRNGQALNEVEAHVLTEESFSEVRKRGHLVIFGDGAAKSQALFPAEQVTLMQVSPSARGLIVPAFAALRAGDFADTAYFEPFYLKNFVVTTSQKSFFPPKSR